MVIGPRPPRARSRLSHMKTFTHLVLRLWVAFAGPLLPARLAMFPGSGSTFLGLRAPLWSLFGSLEETGEQRIFGRRLFHRTTDGTAAALPRLRFWRALQCVSAPRQPWAHGRPRWRGRLLPLGGNRGITAGEPKNATNPTVTKLYFHRKS